VKISIVVAVYNPGRHLSAPVDSFLRQTMPRDDFEVIFVDDGSTDGSGARLDRLARRHRTFSVIHIPNSGWPGRPRNLGIDAARGRYVLFVDHDDWLENDALEYLWSVAEANDADVVAAREVGHGFGVPRRMFRRTIPDAKLGRDDLLALLTPHKLFRRQLLVDHDIRFPEGPRRLEDHHFVIQAYFHARRITVTGDHPVYHWARRDEGTNATKMPFARSLYYDNLRDILDIVDANTDAGDFRDRLYAHWLRYKMIHKLLRPRFRAPGRDARELYAEIWRLMDERFDPAVDRHLPVGYRLVARAVRADRLDLVTAAAEVANGLRLELGSPRVEWAGDGGALHAHLDAALREPGGDLVRLHRDGELLRWQPPQAMVDGLDLEPEDLVVAERPPGELAIVARQRGSDLDFDDPQPFPTRELDGRIELAGPAALRLDPSTFAAGSALGDGTWDLLAQAEFGGFRAVARIPGATIAPVAGPRPRARPYTTQAGHLALQVGSGSSAVPRPARRLLRLPPPEAVPQRARALARRVLPLRVRRAARRMLERLRD
jgi:glycosyltransferase involved in cell wall biosynthesis